MKKKKISQELYGAMLDFIEDMRRYSPQISISSLYHFFGNTTKKIVKGEYPGLFQEKSIEPDFEAFGKFIFTALSERNRKTQRLYGALNKIQDIDDILAGNIRPEKFGMILSTLQQRNIEVPKEMVLLDKFHAKVERKCSPEFLIAGDASVCCMSFGQKKAVTYAFEKGFGIINVYYKDRVIANSLIWVNEPYNCLVLDNIEVHPNYKRYNDILKKLFSKTVLYLLDAYHLDFAVQGIRYNDLELYDGLHQLRFVALLPAEVKTQDFYSDASFVSPLEFKLTKSQIRERIETVNRQISADIMDP